jgi:hypothetical protein
MVCNICSTRIEDGQPMLTVNIGVAGEVENGFTGVAWHVECAPEHREHFRDEAERFARRVSR